MTGRTVECDICGRALRTPQSRARGRGPTCDEKVNPRPVAVGGRDHSPPARLAAVSPADAPTLLDGWQAAP
ncbi:DUF6011 domain-containing protein [Mangrovihabitans endophyticus]|uniref:Uncharacterized protein n=1 Tax=Mangrovihabitans endophyticus TaxID=1751298 RepID=A0A8J3FPE8_9ACTN|nr:DUF6011 domain-containing protein [Mangrovihabitans endophyticus]GGK89423.1 hypothetical protein GCM10012284_24250 [Mangrovihabitans endophyticus]